MSWAIWVTGRPGSGKSTVARAAAGQLAEQGMPVRVLELDRIRPVVTPAPTYSEVERETVYRALVFMAVALTQAGVPVVIDATAHRRAWRELARACIPCFAEVQLDCALEVARLRERARPRGAAPADIYAQAGRPGATVPGVDVPYEPAMVAELTLDTGAVEPAAAAERVAALAASLQPAGARRTAGGEGAVIWITGPPGSGKTTLARRLAAALAADGVDAALLEWAALRTLVFGHAAGTEIQEDIAHRGLAYTAKLVADTGRTVVVDAAAPRRAWRTLARALAGTFAEVQLVCPPEICGDRERAVRWGRQPCPRPGGEPDLAVEYEYSFDPDLLLDTATRSEWTAAEDLLRLARRLIRRRAAG